MLKTVVVLLSLFAASVSTISAIFSLSQSEAILLNCFDSILLHTDKKCHHKNDNSKTKHSPFFVAQ